MVDGSALAALREIRELGVHLSIDDFGTGYSSFSYLAKLPVDGLKIDRAFVSPLDGPNPRDRDIASSIIALAEKLHLGVVAEGIETEGQRQVLLGLGCKLAQGYLFARPLSPALFAAHLATAHLSLAERVA